MTASPAGRHALYSRLEDVLGKEHADELMSSLPPVDADQLATKSDIDLLKDDIVGLRAEMKADFMVVGTRFDSLEDRMHTMFQTFVRTTVYSMVALTAIFSFVMALIWAQ